MEDEFLSDIEDDYVKPVQILENHNTIALTDVLKKRFMECWESGKGLDSHKSMVKVLKDDPYMKSSDYPGFTFEAETFYQGLVSGRRGSVDPMIKMYSDKMEMKTHQIANRVIDIQFKAYLSRVSNDNVDAIRKALMQSIKEIEVPTDLRELYYYYESLRRIRNTIQNRATSGGYEVMSFQRVGPKRLEMVKDSEYDPHQCEFILTDYRAYADKDFIFYIPAMDIGGSVIITRYNELVGIIDSLEAEINISVLALYSPLFPNSPLPDYSSVRAVVSWGREILSERGRKGFKVVKMYESFVLSCLLRRFDPCKTSNGLYEFCVKEYATLDREHSIPDRNHLHELENMILTAGVRASTVVEFIGIFKIWGAVTVDPLASFAALKELCTRTPEICEEVVRLMLGYIKREFTCNFIISKGHWPEIDGESIRESSVLKGLPQNVDFLKTAVPISDWSDLRFLQNFTLDYVDDITRLVKDKSLSLPADDFFLNFNRIIYGLNPKPTERKKRVVLELLSRDEVDYKEWVEDFVENRWDWTEMIVGVCIKYGELKDIGRLFGKMTVRSRIMFNIREHNMNQILKYFPQQTMTQGEQNLSKQFLRFTKDDDEEVASVHNLDYKTWNSRIYDKTDGTLSDTIDDLFGFEKPFFRKTHEFFGRSIIYLSEHYEADPNMHKYASAKEFFESEDFKNSKHAYTGHLTGIEGQQQRIWTVLTIGLVITAAEEVKRPYTITGSGDNMVVRFIYKKPKGMNLMIWLENGGEKELADTHKSFLESIDRLSSKISFVPKLEEVWMTVNCFANAKKWIINGSWKGMSMKKVMRAHDEADSILPTIFDSVSAVMSTCSSAASHSSEPLPLFVFSVYKAARSLLTCMQWNSFGNGIVRAPRSEVNKLLVASLLIPSSLGGFPIKLLPDFYEKKVVDNLTSGLYHLRVLSQFSDEIKGLYNRLSDEEGIKMMFNSKTNFKALVNNPHSCNLRTITAPVGVLRSEALPFLESRYQNNRDIRHLFSLLVRHVEESLLDSMTSGGSLYPKLISMFHKMSSAGIRDKILAALDANSSFLNLIPTFSSSARKIPFYTISVLDLLESRINYVGEEEYYDDYDQAQKMREIGWGKKVLGSTHSYPLSMGRVFKVDAGLCSGCSSEEFIPDQYIFVRLDTQSSEDGPVTDTRGPYDAYLGNVTTSHVSGRKAEADRTNLVLESVVSLVQRLSFLFEPNSRLYFQSLSLISSLTDIDIDYLLSISGSVTSGCIGHRFEPISPPTANGLPNLASHIFFSTDSMAMLNESGASADYDIHYQLIMVTLIGILTQYCNLHSIQSNTGELFFHYHIKEDRLKDVIVDRLGADDDITKVSIIPSVEHKSCFFSMERLQSDGDEPWDMSARNYINDDNKPRLRLSYIVMYDYLARLRRSMMEKRGDVSSDMSDVRRCGATNLLRVGVINALMVESTAMLKHVLRKPDVILSDVISYQCALTDHGNYIPFKRYYAKEFVLSDLRMNLGSLFSLEPLVYRESLTPFLRGRMQKFAIRFMRGKGMPALVTRGDKEDVENAKRWVYILSLKGYFAKLVDIMDLRAIHEDMVRTSVLTEILGKADYMRSLFKMSGYPSLRWLKYDLVKWSSKIELTVESSLPSSSGIVTVERNSKAQEVTVKDGLSTFPDYDPCPWYHYYILGEFSVKHYPMYEMMNLLTGVSLNVVIVLGDGSGGTSRMIHRCFSPGSLIVSRFISARLSSEHRMDKILPSELRGRYVNSVLYQMNTDFNTIRASDDLTSYIKRTSSRASVVVSDIEGDGVKDMTLTQKLVVYTAARTLLPLGRLITKMPWESFKSVQEFSERYFSGIRCFKPNGCREDEVYVIMSGPRSVAPPFIEQSEYRLIRYSYDRPVPNQRLIYEECKQYEYESYDRVLIQLFSLHPHPNDSAESKGAMVDIWSKLSELYTFIFQRVVNLSVLENSKGIHVRSTSSISNKIIENGDRLKHTLVILGMLQFILEDGSEWFSLNEVRAKNRIRDLCNENYTFKAVSINKYDGLEYYKEYGRMYISIMGTFSRLINS